MVQPSKDVLSKHIHLCLKDQDRQDDVPEDVPRLIVEPEKCFLPWLKEGFTRTTKLRVLLGESRLSYLELRVLESEGSKKENPKRSQEGSRRDQRSRAGREGGKPTLLVK